MNGQHRNSVRNDYDTFYGKLGHNVPRNPGRASEPTAGFSERAAIDRFREKVSRASASVSVSASASASASASGQNLRQKNVAFLADKHRSESLFQKMLNKLER